MATSLADALRDQDLHQLNVTGTYAPLSFVYRTISISL